MRECCVGPGLLLANPETEAGIQAWERGNRRRLAAEASGREEGVQHVVFGPLSWALPQS